MTKKIFTFILALLAIATTASAQTKYGIWVGGVEVTSANASNITGGGIEKGTVKYYESQKALYLTDVKISRTGGDVLANTGVDGLIVVFVGTNTLSTHNWSNKDKGAATVYLTKKTNFNCAANSKTTIYATGSTVRAIYKPQADLTIKALGTGSSTGSLTILSNHNGIEGKSYSNATDVMTIEDAQVEITTMDAGLVDFSNITFKGTASTTIKPANPNTAGVRLYQVAKITSEINQPIVQPAGATFDSSKKTITLNGTPINNQTIVIRNYIDIDATNFPDANFRKWLLAQEYGKDEKLTGAELADVRKMDISSQFIANLEGIQHFTKLSELNCRDNKLTVLNVTKNTGLQILRCSNNQLTELDVSKNVYLVILNCSNNRLTSLDVTKHTQLQNLFCDGNQLTSLNVTMNNLLLILYCSNNQLTWLDVAHNRILTDLSCDGNQLTSLNVTMNTNLKGLYCENNQLTSIELTKNATSLRVLRCYGNKIDKDYMNKLVTNLPQRSKNNEGSFHVIDKTNSNEGNFITPSQVETAKSKNWNVWAKKGENSTDAYKGSIAIRAETNYYSYGTVTGAGTYEYGTKATLTATPNKGYKFVMWREGGKQVSTDATYTFFAADNKTYTAVFDKEKYTITATANSTDGGTVTGGGAYEYNTNVTLKATPKTGYKFVKWTENGRQVSTNATYTFTATKNRTLVAQFEKNTPKTLAVTFTKATTLASELSNEDKLVLAAVVVLAQKGKLDGYSVGIDPREKGVVTLKKDKKTLFVSDNNKGITVPSGVTSADNINVTLTDDLRKALGTTLAPQLTGYDAIQIKFDISTPTGIEINATNFPDATFRNYVSDKTIDKDADGYLTDEEIAAVKKINVYNQNIANLKGIEYFTELETLRCYGNQLKSLDVSKNTKLTDLNCHRNQISGDKMQALVESLPTVENGSFSVFRQNDSTEGNVITKSQVDIAKSKGWKAWAFDGSAWSEYAGSDDTTAIDASFNDNGKMTNDSWYTIDGVKLQGEPTKKGVYIIKGKKVKR